MILMYGTISLAMQRLVVANQREASVSKKINETYLKAFEHVKDNIGLYVLAGSVPMILEEGLASKKGIKAAAKTLNAKDLKQFKKGMLCALGSYGLGALVMAGSAAFAVKVWDGLRAAREKNM